MCIVVENECELPVVVTESRPLAAGQEIDAPSKEECALTLQRQHEFIRNIDWKGGTKDTVTEIASPDPKFVLVRVIHSIPRYTACQPEELGDSYKGRIPHLSWLTSIATTNSISSLVFFTFFFVLPHLF